MPLTGDYEPPTTGYVREQVELFERTNGAEGSGRQDERIVLLTTVGAQSGKLRKAPLMRVEHAGEYAVIGSRGGAPRDPAWCSNIRHNTRVELQDGPVKKDYVARELSGDERAVWWQRAVAAYPPYAEYQTRTSRQIPVFLLTAE
jgi:deazaflavin-dependent oxidoreductase (nitroreductase family)